MTASEFSNQFDVLYNNITSNQAPGLNEYEKSVFLTKAQNELVKNYFLPQSNPKQAGFDGNPKRQIDFSKLIVSRNAAYVHLSYEEPYPDPRGFMFSFSDFDSEDAETPMPILYLINESIQLLDETQVVANKKTEGIRQIIALDYTEYTRLMSKPFKEPLKNQAWRLMAGKNSNGSTLVNVVLTSADKSVYGAEDHQGSEYFLPRINYKLRYVKYPIPIILTDLSASFSDLSIEGKQGTAAEGYAEGFCCELDESIHEEILQRAVELAKVAWEGNVQTVVEAGNRSE